MQQIVDIRQIQEIILKIAIEFRNIMDRHHIPYYMIGGTMLGAIRHKGFIPWDDDMDFGIPRPYFQKAKEILCAELPTQYRLLSVDDKAVSSDYYKIEDTQTLIEEEARSVNDVKIGIFIDLFPLDFCNNKWGRFSRNYIIRQLMWYNSFQYKTPRRFYHKNIACLVGLLPKNQLLITAHNLLKNDGDYMINYAGMWGKKELVKKQVIGNPTPYCFEGEEFFGVAQYEEYLQSLYGNYMELPPKEQRHTHLLSCWKK